MQKAPIPTDEEVRIEAVHQMAILDTASEERFDVLTKLAIEKLHVPISTLSIIDSDREWFKSCVGLNTKEGDRGTSFCGHALLAKYLFIVEDTLKDPRFSDNPNVAGSPFIRFYAGVALMDHKTFKMVGVFCIKDIKPRILTLEEIAILINLADRAEKELNLK
jgi:GAF domain-containing protein